MPESLEAEAAVLGSMILDRECIGQVIQLITAGAFYRPEHREIFDALVALYESNSHIDLVLLRDELKKRKKLKSVGGGPIPCQGSRIRTVIGERRVLL